jgi:hypothetical protein
MFIALGIIIISVAPILRHMVRILVNR